MTIQPTIRFAGPDDADVVAGLLRMLDYHYRTDEELPSPADYLSIAKATITGREGTLFLLCFTQEGPAAIACCTLLRPGRDLKGLFFLKDLFVPEEFRGRGLGKAMMRFLAAYALQEGIGRIDLTTDRDNQGAKGLYRALGALEKDKVYFSFTQAEMKDLCS